MMKTYLLVFVLLAFNNFAFATVFDTPAIASSDCPAAAEEIHAEDCGCETSHPLGEEMNTCHCGHACAHLWIVAIQADANIGATECWSSNNDILPSSRCVAPLVPPPPSRHS